MSRCCYLLRASPSLQLQLLTRLVNLGEVQPDDVRGLAVLLADDSPALRAGAGDVIAAMMRQQIQQQLQVRPRLASCFFVLWVNVACDFQPEKQFKSRFEACCAGFLL